MKIFLQKFIAQSGYCSRRRAEELIKKNKVFVNGNLAKIGDKVDENDVVKIGNKIIKVNKEKIYIALNKLIGYVCTNRKFKNEKSVLDLIKTKEKLHIVGRLDKNSRGLLLLTNDGKLTQKLTHPKYEHEKEYEVKINKTPSAQEIKNIITQFKKGVNIGEDGIARVKRINHLSKNKFQIILTQGKKRQIRKMFKALNFTVTDLKRTKINKLKLGNLKEGKWKKIKPNKIC